MNSHHNTIGYSGTAGNGVWAHDNWFHDNATGMTTDSFASGHPGMPQDCAKFERNVIASNNEDYFNDERDAYCKQPPAQRDPKIVCPTFQVPVGTGIGIFGGNGDIVRDNWIYDNWRDGVKLLHVPASFRGEPDKGIDTSFDNTFAANMMGVRPDGTRDPNGNDFWWDEQGRGNCWSDNKGPGGAEPTSNVPAAPGIPLDRPRDRRVAAVPGPEHAVAGQPGEDGVAGDVRHVGSGDEHRPGGVRLVHQAAGASVRRAALGLLLLLLAGCGGGGSDAPRGSGPLVWAEAPLEFTPETLPGDRILTGVLRNEGLRRLRVDLPDLRVRDADGDGVAANPVFLQTFGKPLWSPGRGPRADAGDRAAAHRPDRMAEARRDGSLHGRLAPSRGAHADRVRRRVGTDPVGARLDGP